MLEETTRVQEKLAQIAIAEDEWNKTPLLMFIAKPADGAEESDVAMMLLDGIGDVTARVAHLNDLIQNRDELLVSFFDGRKVIGLVLVSEGWSVSRSVEDQQDLESEVHAMRDMGLSLQDHPQSVELKMFHAVDATGSRLVAWARGEDKTNTFDNDSGLIHDRLELLFKSLVEL